MSSRSAHLAAPQHRGVVHVEGEPGGAAVPADLLAHADVVGVAGARGRRSAWARDTPSSPLARKSAKFSKREAGLQVVVHRPLPHRGAHRPHQAHHLVARHRRAMADIRPERVQFVNTVDINRLTRPSVCQTRADARAPRRRRRRASPGARRATATWWCCSTGSAAAASRGSHSWPASATAIGVAAWDMPGLRRRAPLPDDPLTFAPSPTPRRDFIAALGAERGPCGGHLDGRHDRPVPRRLAPRRSCARSRCSSTSPAFGLDGTAPARVAGRPARPARRGPRAGRLRRPRARRPSPGRTSPPRRSPSQRARDGAHLRRRAAPQHRVPRHPRRRPLLPAIAAPTLVLVGELDARDARWHTRSTSPTTPPRRVDGRPRRRSPAQRRGTRRRERRIVRPSRSRGGHMNQSDTEWRFIRGVRRALRPLRAARGREGGAAQRVAEPAVAGRRPRASPPSRWAAACSTSWCPPHRRAHAVPIRSTGASQAIAHHDAVIAALAGQRPRHRLHGRGAAARTRARSHPGRRRAGADDLQRAPRGARAPAVGRRPAPRVSTSATSGFARRRRCASPALPAPTSPCDSPARSPPAPPASPTAPAPSPTGRAGWCSPSRLRIAVNGTVVLAPGDMNLTFNRLIESPVTLHIVDDHIERHRRRRRRRHPVPLVPQRVRRPRELRHQPRGLGHEPARPMGLGAALRPARDVGHRGPRLRGQLPLLHRRQRDRRPVHRRPLRPADAQLHRDARRPHRGRTTACSCPNWPRAARPPRLRR